MPASKRRSVKHVVRSLTNTVPALLEAFTKKPLERLQLHPRFTPHELASNEAPAEAFRYASASDPLLTEFKEEFKLDAIAGEGSEIERWMRLMNWVHQLTVRSPSPKHPKEYSGLYLARAALAKRQRFNCVMYSTVLNDALLSLGYCSRIVCMYPIQEPPSECHYIVTVFSRELKKWVMLDADFRTIVTNEQGIPLHPGEIREHLLEGKHLLYSDSIHSNGVISRWLVPKRFWKWSLSKYLAKNVFRFQGAIESSPRYEDLPSGRTYIQLIPDGYHDEWLDKPRETKLGNTIIYTRDETYFWSVPDSELQA